VGLGSSIFCRRIQKFLVIFVFVIYSTCINLGGVVGRTFYRGIRSTADSPIVTFFVYMPLVTRAPVASAVEENESSGAMSLLGVSLDSINLMTSTVKFVVTGATYLLDRSSILLLRNGQPVDTSGLILSVSTIEAHNLLLDGRNNLVLFAKDSQNHDLSLRETVWAGNNNLLIKASLPNGQPALNSLITLRLADAQAISTTLSLANGEGTFQNVPDTTIFINADDGTGRTGFVGATGKAQTISITLSGLGSPSSISNNDFSLGTAGWNIGTAPVSIVPHSEAVLLNNKVIVEQKAPNPLFAQADSDLILRTQGEGPQSISRSFTTQPGTTNTRLRYRFVTSEVPGGYFGSKYNDYFGVSIRSSQGGGAYEANSMNGLGLASFDSIGATIWREVSLPTSVDGDTIQVDLTIANVADNQYNSQLIVDSVDEEKLAIKADKESACINQDISFMPVSNTSSTIQWSSDGLPTTGSGNKFVTHFTESGDKVVKAVIGDGTDGQTAEGRVKIYENSGGNWVSKFPNSHSTSDLAVPFQNHVLRFLGALSAAGANYAIDTTYRPRERAFLMHYAWMIAREGMSPDQVPHEDGIDICWQHYGSDGKPNNQLSRDAASAMVQAYGIVYRPSLVTRHTEKLAIDVNISWSGNLTVVDGTGAKVVINTAPRDNNNIQLQQVGATYEVYKLPQDKPHWSDDGH